MACLSAGPWPCSVPPCWYPFPWLLCLPDLSGNRPLTPSSFSLLGTSLLPRCIRESLVWGGLGVSQASPAPPSAIASVLGFKGSIANSCTLRGRKQHAFTGCSFYWVGRPGALLGASGVWVRVLAFLRRLWRESASTLALLANRMLFLAAAVRSPSPCWLSAGTLCSFSPGPIYKPARANRVLQGPPESDLPFCHWLGWVLLMGFG